MLIYNTLTYPKLQHIYRPSNSLLDTSNLAPRESENIQVPSLHVRKKKKKMGKLMVFHVCQEENFYGQRNTEKNKLASSEPQKLTLYIIKHHLKIPYIMDSETVADNDSLHKILDHVSSSSICSSKLNLALHIYLACCIICNFSFGRLLITRASRINY